MAKSPAPSVQFESATIAGPNVFYGALLSGPGEYDRRVAVYDQEGALVTLHDLHQYDPTDAIHPWSISVSESDPPKVFSVGRDATAVLAKPAARFAWEPYASMRREEGTAYFRSGFEIVAASVTRDGKRIAVVDGQELVCRLYDVAGRPVFAPPSRKTDSPNSPWKNV